MINSLIEKLNSFSEIKDYRIIHNLESRKEVYYIGDKVETIRNVDLSSSIDVTIYCDYLDKRGTASFKIYDSYTDEEINKKILEAIKYTNFTKNTYFDLPSGYSKNFVEHNVNYDNEILFKIGDAIISSSKGYYNGWLSSFEIFITTKTIHILNSKGVDYTYNKNKVFLEIIPTFSNNGHEIELYNALSYEFVDIDKIKEDVKVLMRNAFLRNNALKYRGPNEVKVMLNASEIKTIFKELVNNFSYASIFNKMNLLNVNDSFYGENCLDHPNIILKPKIDNSTLNTPVDNDGIVLNNVTLVDNNKIVHNHGSNQYGSYLGIKDISGVIPNICLESGTYPTSNLKSEPYLHCISFSSFQFDIYSGNFGGEVRLAIYFDGVNEIPVSGLTIGGNIHELKSHLKFSLERENIDGYSGPKYVLIENMNAN